MGRYYGHFTDEETKTQRPIDVTRLRPHSSCRSRLKSMLTARLMLLTPHQAVSHGAMMRGPFCIAQHLQQGRDHLEIDFQAVVGSRDKML